MELQHYILQCSSFSEIRNQSSFAPGAGALYGEEKHSHHGHLSTCTEQGAKLDHFVSPHTNGSVNPERYLHSREGVNQAVREIKGERHECSLRKVLIHFTLPSTNRSKAGEHSSHSGCQQLHNSRVPCKF